MPHPTWLAYTFAFVMVTVSLYCIAWLIAAKRRSAQNHVDVNFAHVAMGLAMAGMLVPRLNVIPDGVWEVVFVTIALWFSWQGVRVVAGHVGNLGVSGRHSISHSLIHLVMALAMLYMYLANVPTHITAAPTMSMMAPTGTAANFLGLPLLFVVILFASAVWQLDGMSRYTPSRPVLVDAAVTPTPDPSTPGHGSLERSVVSVGEPPRPLEPDAAPQQWLAPRLEMGCHIAMCITMGYMLILML